MYRCNAVKYRSKIKCEHVARIVYEEGKFIIEHNGKEHTCDELNPNSLAKPALSDKIVEEIRALFIGKVRKPQRILMSLRAIKSSSNPELYFDEPSQNQIKYQVKKLKQEFYGSGEISLRKLEKFLQENSATPECEDESYVIGYQVKYSPNDRILDLSGSDLSNDEQDDAKRHFWMLYSTKRLLRLASKVKLVCCDTTFKFLWLGYPAILIGTTDLEKQFHPLAFGFTSAENSQMFYECFNVSF